MAQRRMFSKDVVEMDDFLDMPISSQALYYHLGVQADDHGFVQPKRVMRMTNTGDDDLRVLIGRKFVLPFESGVIVIRHWKQNNYLQSDRVKPTLYTKEQDLLIEDGGVYNLDTKCIQNVSQYRGVESRVGESRGGKESPERKPKAHATALVAPDAYIAAFKAKYPGKDVDTELAKAYSWLQASGKPYKNYQQFYNYWLLKADSQGGKHGTKSIDLSHIT